MISIKIIIPIFLAIVITQSYDCQLHPSFQERIDKDLSFFNTGIPPSMLNKLKKLKRSFYFTVKDHIMTSSWVRDKRNANEVWDNWRQYFISLAPHLPDMEFLVNLYDEPRILKRKCSPQ